MKRLASSQETFGAHVLVRIVQVKLVADVLTQLGNLVPIARLGFKGLCMQDGPAAIRQATFVSVFPAGLTIAATWDRKLMNTRGSYLGAEFKAKGAHVMLGPVAGPLCRSAFAGRGWEGAYLPTLVRVFRYTDVLIGFSPDPYLTGVAMEETITGIQSTGVQANAKRTPMKIP
jgi:beta-glucosidase